MTSLNFQDTNRMVVQIQLFSSTFWMSLQGADKIVIARRRELDVIARDVMTKQSHKDEIQYPLFNEIAALCPQ